MRRLVISISLILLPALFVFKNYFLPGPLVAGDAPHFFAEELGDLTYGMIAEPSVWSNRGLNFGGVTQPFWLHPLMIAYKYLGQALGNDLVIRVLFYFPAVIMAAVGPALLARHFKLSKTVGFFSSLVYLLNTYFILMIDGGQVGVALAYGLFPIALLFLIKGEFWSALLFSFLLTVADPRIAVICILTSLLWSFNVRRTRYYLSLAVALLGLTAYWWAPYVRIESAAFLGTPSLAQVRLRHATTLFNPHWPGNVFGVATNPPLYFYGVSVLILGNLVWSRKRKLVTLFLVFVLLSAGFYYPLVELVPFGSAFRDSTKFFIPLVLIGGMLIGKTVEKLKGRFRAAEFVVVGYLLFLVYPALLGKMNFVLAGKTYSSDYQTIYEQLREQEGSFRTVWFPERHPMAFETEEKPALDAKGLVDLYAFGAMNAGSFDRFNFMNNMNFEKWFDVLGIKYLVMSGDGRKVEFDDEERELWQDLKGRVATASGIYKTDWGQEVEVYENKGVYPRVYGVDELSLVVGPMLEEAVAAVYFEDGKLDPRNLEGIASESAKVHFNGKDKQDLAMSFLQEYFQGPKEAVAEWAVYGPDEYLTYKYQLLIRDYEYLDFDYGRGIAFSTRPGEKMKYVFDVTQEGEYVFVQRKAGPGEDLGWEVQSKGHLKKGKHEVEVISRGELSLLNVVGLVPQEQMEEAEGLVETFVVHFGEGDVDEDWEVMEVVCDKKSPTEYDVKFTESMSWVVLSDSFHPDWELRRDRLKYPSVPVYSAFNAFYRRPGWDRAQVYFKGQDQLRWGIWLSVVSATSLGIIYLWKRK